MKPLLTFALVACNQERFIGEAVRGALSQTYSPLQIVLSDDASSDGTFEVMRGMSAAYRGPNKIVLNRNVTNEGLANHVNRIARMAKGELVVAAAGDDISLPERTTVLFEAWNSTGRNAHCLHSRVTHIGESGKPIAPPAWEPVAAPTHCIQTEEITLARYIETQQPEVFGCACAWSPTLFKVFGELPEDVIHEDNAIVLRSLMLGPLVFVDTPLVEYRLHQTNIFNVRSSKANTVKEFSDQEQRMRRDFTRRAIMYRGFCKDITTARDERLLSSESFTNAYDLARKYERIFSLQRDFMTARPGRKARILLQLCKAGAELAQIKQLTPRILPLPAIIAAQKAIHWLKHSTRPRNL